MRSNWPKLDSLAKITLHFCSLQFCECVYYSKGSYRLESILTKLSPTFTNFDILSGGGWPDPYLSLSRL